MKEVSVSVVIPLYNKAPYVERAIASILAQRKQPQEIIVVDDGSSDEGPAIVRRIRDPRVALIQQENAGPGAARNRGVQEATSDFIAFLDADDEWLPDFLSSMSAHFDADPSLAVASCGYIDDPPGYFRLERYRRQGLTAGIQAVAPETPAALLSWRASFMSTCTTLARIDAFRRWDGFYTRDKCRYAEDQTLFVKWLLNERVRFVLEPHGIYHRTVSELNAQRNGPRPLEPFLVYPEILRDACPPALSGTLDRFLAYRALRAAAMLGYWGRSAEARTLVRRLVPFSGLLSSVPGLQALVACTPAGRWFGPLVFSLMSRLNDDMTHVQTKAIGREASGS